jgi:endoglucanase
MKFKFLNLAVALLATAFMARSQTTIVEKYGQLKVKGSYILSEKGDTVQLRGMSFFWHQWMGQFYNPGTVKWLRDDWKCTVVRAAIGVESGGYLEQPFEAKDKTNRIVKAAIEYGIYVIIDYHSHEAHNDVDAAKKFFAEMSKKYGKYPNVIYEIYNEPLKDISWNEDIKPYAEEVIKTIRENDPDNLIICGTRQWSQLVAEASLSPVKDSNTVYTLHFYAASHGEGLREGAKRAIENGIAIFVSEFGTCDYTGSGPLDYEATKEWLKFLDEYKISWCNWSIADKEETSAAVYLGASWSGKWKESKLTPSGKFIREELIRKNGPIFKSLVPVEK